jgi:hypothetical protein
MEACKGCKEVNNKMQCRKNNSRKKNLMMIKKNRMNWKARNKKIKTKMMIMGKVFSEISIF